MNERAKRKWRECSETLHLSGEEDIIGYEGSQAVPARLSGRIEEKVRRWEMEKVEWLEVESSPK
jgi:hypothetical protein